MSAPVAEAVIGHNNPPSPFDAIKVHIEDLFTEATNWADGEPVASPEQADEVSRLMEDLRTAAKDADELRKQENEPFDQGKAEVQGRYNPLLADTKTVKGKIPMALDALKSALQPWLLKLDAEKREREEAARRAAEAAAKAASDAVAASAPDDLASREAAEALVSEAQRAERAATVAANDKAQAHGGTRATGLRSYFSPELVDPRAALNHYCQHRAEEVKAFLLDLAKTDVREGKRQIPGFEIIEEKKVV